MKLAKEIKMLRKAEKRHDDYMYPGYPFMIHGIVDMKNGVGYINRGNAMSLEKFIHEFSAELCYHMVNNSESTKGSWLQNTKMQEHEKYLEADYDEFYIDNLEVTQLYFALFAAIRETRGKDSLIYWGYDGDSEYKWVEVFTDDESGSKEEKIRQYLADYYEIKA